jgi:hypothetical protein
VEKGLQGGGQDCGEGEGRGEGGGAGDALGCRGLVAAGEVAGGERDEDCDESGECGGDQDEGGTVGRSGRFPLERPVGVAVTFAVLMSVIVRRG